MALRVLLPFVYLLYSLTFRFDGVSYVLKIDENLILIREGKMDWDECKAAFYVDGSLRDIYIHNTTAADWNKFLTYTSTLKTSYSRQGEANQLPTQVTEIFEENDETSFGLVIELGKVKLNCHFFTVHEIELDIDPKEVTSQQDFDAVIDVFVGIGKSLDKDVVLTDENLPKSKWFEYHAATGTVAFTSA